MSDYTPPFPRPHKKKSTALLYLLRGWYSWIHASYERSYTMKMGQVWTPRNTLYIINEPSLVRKVMVEDWRKFPKHKLLWIQLRSLLGDSIFTTNGAVWEKQRRMIDPAFQGARMKVILPLMQAAVDDMLKRFGAVADNHKPEDVEIEMTHITADIIFRTILSKPINAEEAATIFHAFNKYQEKTLRSMILKACKLPSFYFDRQADAYATEIRNILAGLIRVRYDAYHSGRPGAEQDILASLLAEVDTETGQHFSYEELVDHVSMLFLAGHETSASALTWALYLIANTPDIQERMVEEVRAAISDRPVEFGELKKMRLTWNVFRETLRLYPPVGYFVREASETQMMRDKKVKKGCPIGISPLLIQRHRKMWDRPDVFDPDRWDSEESKQSQKDAYLPFGAGPRVCIGAAFATQEATLILANLVRSFRFEPIAGDIPEPVGRVTIRSANGVRLMVSRRASAQTP
jgi:cytochrome P450